MVKNVKITFWGVRGSMASPWRNTVKYGGNTSCVEIEAAGARIICDAGTGLMALGKSLVKMPNPISAHIILSHVHWDHYLGLPFFLPFYKSRNRFVLAGPICHGKPFVRAISRAMHPPYFPISIPELPAKIRLKTLPEKPFKIGKILVKPMKAHHPGGSFGWRFEFPGGKVLAHVSDNEPSTGRHRKKLVKWLSGADILIHDAQYTPAGYKKHRGWGHSPFTYPIELAKETGIKRVFLFHFDPRDSDSHLDAVRKIAKKIAKRCSPLIECELAREGTSVIL